MVKESACLAGDLGLIPRLGRSLEGGHGNPLQYYCLEKPHGQRSLAGYSPWHHKESDATERLSIAHGRRIFLLSIPFPDLLIFPNHFHYYCYLSSHSSFHSAYLWLKQTNKYVFIFYGSVQDSAYPRSFPAVSSSGVLFPSTSSVLIHLSSTPHRLTLHCLQIIS